MIRAQNVAVEILGERMASVRVNVKQERDHQRQLRTVSYTLIEARRSAAPYILPVQVCALHFLRISIRANHRFV